MSTIGHPLLDLTNLITPFYTAKRDPTSIANAHPSFLPGATPGLPTPDEITALYFSVAYAPPDAAGAVPPPSAAQARERSRELQWTQAFNIFRQAAICQGIAARQAARQASSERAKRYADARNPMAEYAWELIGQVKDLEAGKPRL